MAELPSGTVTFLFSDVEGSTRLLTRLGGRYADVLGEHQRLLRAAFEEHDGREVHTEGDAFFVAFARARDAIAAAVSAQRALASRRWPEGVDVRVRMGVHTGVAEVRLDDYVGLDVHRAERICSAGHGGQVLISGSTRELVGDELPTDVGLRDLGEHRLKDLDRPEHLFQLAIGELPTDFPPLASLSRGSGRANGLPSSPNPTIGRADDVQAIADRLRDDGVRLLTLTGPGGVGKTRLGLEVAHLLDREFRDGAWFVELAAIAEPDHVESAIAKALSLTPLAGEAPADALARFLAPRQALLVLDNFEHLLSAAPLVSELLAKCAALKVLATSRAALRVQPEHRVLVEPLGLPAGEEPAEVERSAAGALFLERADSVGASFPVDVVNARAIAGLCRRLDGLPLAIELAAARTTVLDPEELNTRLARALDVLGGGPRDAPDRQRTLRATIDWSHRLLNAQEAEAFTRFAVFAGGATIEAAQAITGAELETLEGLVDKQLLLRGHGSGPEARLLMLETVRQYARERLDADQDVAEIRGRHFRHYTALVERAEPELFTRGEDVWLPRLDAEIHNLRAALDWSLHHGDPVLALRLAGLLPYFWDIRNMVDEGLEWIEASLHAAGNAAPLPDRARARRAQVFLLENKGAAYDAHGLMAEARTKAAEALNLSRRVGDPAAIADALLSLAGLDSAESFPQLRRRELANQALIQAGEAGDDRLVARALLERASAGQPERKTIEEAATALRKLGSSRLLVGLYCNAAYNALKCGSPSEAGPIIEKAVPVARKLGDPAALAFVCGNVGMAALLTGDPDRARIAFVEQLQLCREQRLIWLAAEGLAGLAAIRADRSDLERAARLLGAATAAGPWDADADVKAQLDRRFFAAARDSFGNRPWDDAHAAGTRLTFEEAIDYALDLDASPAVET